MKNPIELPDKFWKKWENADYFERKELIKSLPLLKEFVEAKMDKDLKEYAFINLLNSYFEDLLIYARRGYNHGP